MKSLLVSAVATVLLIIPRLANADATQGDLNHGYSLLHHLCEQEKQVDLILMVKTTPPAVAAFLHEVAKSADSDMAVLDHMAAHDSAIRFNDQGLPLIESKTRDSIKADKQHMLLFGTKDTDFAKTLLITQVEAGTYGMNMASVMADEESNGHRATELRRISSRWEKIRNKAYALIYKM
jgi:hypothetical protein